MTLAAYGMDARLKTVDHGAVDVAGAMRLIDGCLRRSAREYVSAEEATEALDVSFENEDEATLTVQVLAPDKIHVSFEGTELIEPALLGFTFVCFKYDKLLASREEVVETISAFDRSTDEEMREFFIARFGRESWWSRLRRR